MFINMLITALISSSGETSVAAVNLVAPVATLAICVLNGVCAGGAVAVAQCSGSGSAQKTQQAAGQSLWLTLLCGVMVGLVMLLLPRLLLTLLYAGAEAQVLEKAITYMALSSFSLILYSIYYAVFSILRGLGESRRCPRAYPCAPCRRADGAGACFLPSGLPFRMKPRPVFALTKPFSPSFWR